MSDTAASTAPEPPPVAQPVRYQRPEVPDGPLVGKFVVRLARTDRVLELHDGRLGPPGPH